VKWVLSAVVLLGVLTGFSPFATAAENAPDSGKKTLIMGTSADYPPYENVDAKNGGEIVGMDIDLARQIADKLGFELQISSMDFNGLIAALQTGRVDFVMSAMSATEERRKNVDFSDIYYIARNTIVSNQNHNYTTLEQLADKRIGVQLGSTQEAVVAELAGAQIKKLNKIPDLIQELKSGRLDAAIVEDAVALGYTSANPDLRFNMIPSGSSDEGYAIAFPKGSPLVSDFNRALAEMEQSGDKDAIVNKWFNTGTKDVSSSLNLDFSILKDYVPYMLRGIYVTLLFTLVSALFGFIWGTVLSMFKLSSIRPLKWFANVYTSIFRGTPLLLQLLLIYLAIPQLFNYQISPLLAAGLAFGLNSAAYLSETIRGGIIAVDRGQREAALALGLSEKTTMMSIVLPQAFKNILPALVNECVALVKESSLVSVIGVADILRRANVIQATEFRAFEPLLFAGLIYYVLVLILTSFAGLLERRLRRSD
jgi:polar amino acid transport system substrate-binding protein